MMICEQLSLINEITSVSVTFMTNAAFTKHLMTNGPQKSRTTVSSNISKTEEIVKKVCQYNQAKS